MTDVVETTLHKFTDKALHVQLQNPSIDYADSPNLDSFGRLRTSAPFGIFDSKQIHSRNISDWEERIVGAIIVHGAVTGTFTVGDTFSGGTSGTRGTITLVAVGTFTYSTTNGNDFTDGETITILTGGVPGSTAVITTHNTGSDIVYNFDRSSSYLTVGTVSGARVIRQTDRYFPYVPGKGHHVAMTGIFGVGKTNVKQYVIVGDDRDGLGYCLNGTTISILIRSSSSGSVVDTLIPQSSWSIDTLNPAYLTNPSGITLDITKCQIFNVDFQWLGVGRVRFDLNIGGVAIPVHEIKHANINSVVYMKTPTLPVRYEIINTGTSASATSLEQICCSVSSEGGYALPGAEYAQSNGITRVAVTTRRPILAIRLKNAFPTGKPNRRTVRISGWSGSARTNDGHFSLFHMHDPLTLTATWISAGVDSAVEYSTDISVLTAMMEHRVQTTNIAAGQGSASGTLSLSTDNISNHSFISQNIESTNSQIFAIFVTAESGTCNAAAAISYIECE